MTEKMNSNSPTSAEKEPGVLYGKVVAHKQPKKAARTEGSRLAKAEKTTEKAEKAVAVKTVPKSILKSQKRGGQSSGKQPCAKETPKSAPESALRNTSCKPEKNALLPEVLV